MGSVETRSPFKLGALLERMHLDLVGRSSALVSCQSSRAVAGRRAGGERSVGEWSAEPHEGGNGVLGEFMSQCVARSSQTLQMEAPDQVGTRATLIFPGKLQDRNWRTLGCRADDQFGRQHAAAGDLEQGRTSTQTRSLRSASTSVIWVFSSTPRRMSRARVLRAAAPGVSASRCQCWATTRVRADIAHGEAGQLGHVSFCP